MLALLSDLHFCDQTAVDKNVAPKAFAIALDGIYKMALDLAAAQRDAVALDLVFLGDIFDLLRTERWFQKADGTEVPPSERPWAAADALDGAPPPPRALEHAAAILEDIIANNHDALAELTASRPQLAGKVRVRRILLAGNHDRLCLHSDTLHARMRQALAAVDERSLGAEGIFTHRLELPAYGLLARHGHEHDAWNFARQRKDAPAGSYTDADYLPAPIGDPITTELAARLPFEMRARLRSSAAFTPEEADQIHRRLQRLEDVRPVVTALQWAFQETEALGRSLPREKAGALRQALRDSVLTMVEGFKDLDFYRAWRAGHHLFRTDAQAILRDLLEVLAVVRADAIANAAVHFEKLADRVLHAAAKDAYRAGAGLEALDRMQPRGHRCVVYGHTHEPAFAALRATPAAEDAYLNSGTFRGRIFHTDDHRGFLRVEHMSYLCFFTADEAQAGWGGPGPAFTSWTGVRTPG